MDNQIRREIICVSNRRPQPYHSGWACNTPCLDDMEGSAVDSH